MSASLRPSAHSFLAKIIVFFMAAIFVLWGIADMLRNVGGSDDIATVGKTQISLREFQNAVKRRRSAQPVEVLETLIDKLLLEKEEETLGIRVTDDTVAEFLREAPEFKGADGQFDKALYQQLLQDTGRSERMFVQDIRLEIAKKLLLAPLISDVQVPEEMALAQYKSQEEQRSARIVRLTAAGVAASVPKPTDAEIKAYYDAHPKDFTAPEYRALSFITLPIAAVAAKIDVPQDEIKQTYSEHKDDYHEPDRREVEDMEFDNELDAKEAAKALAQGKAFADVAKSAPLANKGKTSLGAVTIQDLPSDFAGKIFALQPGAYTDPLFIKFRWHIYSAAKSEPGRPQTLQEATAAIKREIASREAVETAQKIMNGFEDTMAGGATLEQATDKIGQKVQQVTSVTRQGTDAEGKKVDLPPYETFLTVAFATAEKDHSQAVQARDGSYFLVRVDSIAPEHVRPLAEVKEQATAGALAEKTGAALEKAAKSLYDQLHSGKPAAGMPQAVEAGHIKRASESVPDGALKDKPLSRALVAELFRIRPGDATHAYPNEDGSYMIATLAQVTPAPAKPDAAALDDIRKSLKTTLMEETLQRYVNYLHGKYPVIINNAAFESVKGAENTGEGNE